MITLTDEQILKNQDTLLESKKLINRIIATSNFIYNRTKDRSSCYNAIVIPSSLVPLFEKAKRS